MTLPLAIWTTGRPVPEAEEKRGNFFTMISQRLTPGFSGPLLDIDSETCTEYPDPKTLSGIVVSGSPARLGEQTEWMKRAVHELRRAHESAVPILGICFGHQLLGQALGGKVAPNPQGREIGTPTLSQTQADPLFDGINDPPAVVMTHLDSVVEVNGGTQILGTTDQEKHAALRFSKTTWGVQFHPEMDSEIVGYYIEARRQDLIAEGRDVDQLLRLRRESRYGATLMERFARFCKTGEFD